MAEFPDRSYPAISDCGLDYIRGDGYRVQFSITHPDAICGPAKLAAQQASIPIITVPLGITSAQQYQPYQTTLKVSDQVTLRTEPQKVNRAIASRPIVGDTVLKDVAVFDNDAVGSRFTICILFSGEERFYDMHKRCIDSLLATVPLERVDIRVGSNQLNDKSVAMLDDYVARKQITKHYRHLANDYKYPVMREMFFDPALPIRTKWVLWFDDDSICDKNPDWLQLLAQHIVLHHKNGNNHMFGARLVWTLSQAQKNIFATRLWYTGKPWQNSGGRASPGGSKITFATGGFWAITYEAIVKCDIPDLTTGLTHNGGDWQIGCQVYQQGYGIKQFNGNKQFVNTSSVPRRGVTIPVIGSHTVPLPPDANKLPAIPTRPPQQSPQEQPPKPNISGIIRL